MKRNEPTFFSRSALLAVAVLLSLPGWLSGCRSRCSSDADCVKSCPCTAKGGNQEDRDTSQLCSLGMRCQNTFCEEEEGWACGVPPDEFCDKYASRGLCGSRRCSDSDDCIKKCSCVFQLTVNNQTTDCCFTLRVQGSCDQEVDACDAEYARTCESLCGDITTTTATNCNAFCEEVDIARQNKEACTVKSCKTETNPFPVPLPGQ